MGRRRIDTDTFKPDHRAWTWCATLNNARFMDVDIVAQRIAGASINAKNGVTWFLASVEHGPLRDNDWVTPDGYSDPGNTPHLQCAFQTKVPISWACIRDFLNKQITSEKGWSPTFRVFPCNGSDEDQVEYCMKEGTLAIEGGERRPCERASRTGGQGKRKDMDDIRDELIQGKDMTELKDKYFSQFAQFERYFVRYRADLMERNVKESLMTDYDNVAWKPWQLTILKKVLADDLQTLLPVRPRKLTAVVDHIGASGKSFLSTFLAVKHGFLVLSPNSKRDLAYILTQTLASGMSVNGIIIDIARSMVGTGLNEHLPNTAMAAVYNFIECCHDGRIVNTKYESKTVFFKPMHTLMFTNHDLETRSEYTLSRDRFDVMHLRAGVLMQTTGGSWD